MVSLFKRVEQEGVMMSELDKLELYLKEHGYHYERTDKEAPKGLKKLYGKNYEGQGEWHQIIVYDDNGERLWDAVCHWGSYGFYQGLLEIMGETVVNPDNTGGDTVEGDLTAQDIIDRIEV